MSKSSASIETLPPAAGAALRTMGGDLGLARQRRKQSLRAWAQRLNVSVPTLMRMEKGDPTVGAGVYATAIWMINRHEALASVADPKDDLAALELDIRAASSRHARGARAMNHD